jgi:hypothetical protein
MPLHNGSFREILVGGIPIPRYTQLKVGLPSRRTLEHRWKEERPDMVHVATEGPLGWSALAAARQLGIRVATDFHTNFHAYTRDYGLGWLARPVAAYLRSFHNRAECTMVPTRQIADELATQRFERLRVVGRGVDADVFTPVRRSTELRASWGADEGTLVALCVSRRVPASALKKKRALTGPQHGRAWLLARYRALIYAEFSRPQRGDVQECTDNREILKEVVQLVSVLRAVELPEAVRHRGGDDHKKQE